MPRPERTADVKLENADRKELVKALYSAWLSTIDKESHDFLTKVSNPDSITEICDTFYGRAHNLIKPYKERFCGTLDTAEMGFTHDSTEDAPSGLYLSALLNETKIGKLVIGGPQAIRFAGYRMKPKKTIEILEKASVTHTAVDAEGGTVVNYGNMGTYDARSAKGLILVNFGRMNFPDYAEGGTHLNFGEHFGQTFGWNARDSVEVEFKNADERNYGLTGRWTEVYLVSRSQVGKDKKLKALGIEISEAGKAHDIPKIQGLARKVDAHVRKKYPKVKSDDPGSF